MLSPKVQAQGDEYSKLKNSFEHFQRKLQQVVVEGSMTTDHEPTDREQTDRGQRQLAEKGDPKYIFAIPRAILQNPHFVTKSLRRNQ